MHEFKINSRLLRNERSAWLTPPRNPDTCRELLLFLDGEFYLDRVGAPATVARLKDSGHLRDTWTAYLSHRTLEDRWVECPCNPDFARFLVEECLPEMAARAGRSPGGMTCTLVGLSYTGLAAAFAALEYEGAFRAVLAQSGSFWWSDEWLARQVRGSAKGCSTRFWLDVGNLERTSKILHRPGVFQGVSQIEGVENFRKALEDRGIPVRQRIFEGGHDMRAWAAVLPQQLQEMLPPVQGA